MFTNRASILSSINCSGSRCVVRNLIGASVSSDPAAIVRPEVHDDQVAFELARLVGAHLGSREPILDRDLRSGMGDI